MVTLLARSTKHYLIELEDQNETINEREKDHNDEGMDAKPRKVLTLDIVTNIQIQNQNHCRVFHQDIGKGTSKIKHFGAMLERGATGVLDIGGMRNITVRVQIVR